MNIDKVRSVARKGAEKLIENWSRDQLEEGIASISVTLKGTGIDVGERIFLNEERNAMRAKLGQL